MCVNNDLYEYLYVCVWQAVMNERGVGMMMTTEVVKLKCFKARLRR